MLLSCAQLYWNSPINVVEPLPVYNIITAVGFGGGSILFTFGAALLLARQVMLTQFSPVDSPHPCLLHHARTVQTYTHVTALTLITPHPCPFHSGMGAHNPFM